MHFFWPGRHSPNTCLNNWLIPPTSFPLFTWGCTKITIRFLGSKLIPTASYLTHNGHALLCGVKHNNVAGCIHLSLLPIFYYRKYAMSRLGYAHSSARFTAKEKTKYTCASLITLPPHHLRRLDPMIMMLKNFKMSSFPHEL